MTKYSLQHEIIKINIESNVRYIYAHGWRTRGCGATWKAPCSFGARVWNYYSTTATVSRRGRRYVAIRHDSPALRVGERSGHERTHTQSGRALTRRRGHTRARGTRTRNPRCTTPIEETVWLRSDEKSGGSGRSFEKKLSFPLNLFQNDEDKFYSLFLELAAFLFPAPIYTYTREKVRNFWTKLSFPTIPDEFVLFSLSL